MKIAMIGQKGIPARAGGIERHVEELSAELAAQGHDVLVFCRPWYVWPIGDLRGIRCIAAPSIARKHLDAITHTFASIVKAAREDADIFHFHGVGPSLLAWMPKLLKPNAKVIATFHCIDRHHQKWNWFARASLYVGEWCATRFPDATISVSKTLQAYCRLSFAADTVYIPNGTHIPVESPDLAPLESFGLKDQQYLMMCARLVRHKGAHVLIRAWKKLKKQYPELVGDKKLAIVGGSAWTERYVEELKKMAKSEPSIVLTGAQTGDQLAALFAGAYALVHPSESEGLPIAILEAMGYGKCVLSSDIPESLEIVEGNGLTFRTGDVNDLVEKLKMLLEEPSLVKAVGDEAREFVTRDYDWQDIAQTTGFLYEYLHFDGAAEIKHV